jgi:hypothetical protein
MEWTCATVYGRLEGGNVCGKTRQATQAAGLEMSMNMNATEIFE